MREITSPTKRPLSPTEVADVVAEALGVRVDPAEDCVELSAAGFASVWRVTLGGGAAAALKVAPPAAARILRYEHDLLREEARYFRLVADTAPGVPVPDVLFYGDSSKLAGAPVLLARFLPGTSLAEAPPELDDTARAAVHEQLGAAIARVHGIAGARFGYSGDRPHGATWPEAFAAILESLLDDARDWRVELPVTPQALRAAVGRNEAALAEVTTPALVHFDLWDGNVLAEPALDGQWRLSGLVDGERHLFGDPLVDLVSPALFRHIEDEPANAFLRGYVGGRETEAPFSDAALARLRLYRAHLYLLMLVEMPSRGMTAETHADRLELLTELLPAELASL